MPPNRPRRAFEADVAPSLRVKSASLGEVARGRLGVLEGTEDEEALGHPAVDGLGRAEKALRRGDGLAPRYSRTMGVDRMYFALAVEIDERARVWSARRPTLIHMHDRICEPLRLGT